MAKKTEPKAVKAAKPKIEPAPAETAPEVDASEGTEIWPFEGHWLANGAHGAFLVQETAEGWVRKSVKGGCVSETPCDKPAETRPAMKEDVAAYLHAAGLGERYKY